MLELKSCRWRSTYSLWMGTSSFHYRDLTTATEALRELGYFTVSRCRLIAQRLQTSLQELGCVSRSGRTATVHLPAVRQRRGQELATT